MSSYNVSLDGQTTTLGSVTLPAQLAAKVPSPPTAADIMEKEARAAANREKIIAARKEKLAGHHDRVDKLRQSKKRPAPASGSDAMRYTVDQDGVATDGWAVTTEVPESLLKKVKTSPTADAIKNRQALVEAKRNEIIASVVQKQKMHSSKVEATKKVAKEMRENFGWNAPSAPVLPSNLQEKLTQYKSKSAEEIFAKEARVASNREKLLAARVQHAQGKKVITASG